MEDIMDGLRPHLRPALHWMELHRQKAMAKIDENLEYVTYDELRKSLTDLTEGNYWVASRRKILISQPKYGIVSIG